jgi:regulator of replication initiation timing
MRLAERFNNLCEKFEAVVAAFEAVVDENKELKLKVKKLNKELNEATMDSFQNLNR